jgi:hypothetical protein
LTQLLFKCLDAVANFRSFFKLFAGDMPLKRLFQLLQLLAPLQLAAGTFRNLADVLRIPVNPSEERIQAVTQKRVAVAAAKAAALAELGVCQSAGLAAQRFVCRSVLCFFLCRIEMEQAGKEIMDAEVMKTGKDVSFFLGTLLANMVFGFFTVDDLGQMKRSLSFAAFLTVHPIVPPSNAMVTAIKSWRSSALTW